MKCFYFFLAIFLVSCQVRSDRKMTSESNERHYLVKPIDFDAYDPVFHVKFPDTTLDFHGIDQLASYSMKKQQDFEAFCDSINSKQNESDSIMLAINAAQIEFYRLLEILYFRQLQKFPKNDTTMAFLSYLSDKGGVDIRERERFFNLFPAAVRTSETGKNTWRKIHDYISDSNIGKTTDRFSTLQLLKSNGSLLLYPQVVNRDHDYYVLVFGASWCKPCILDEKQLKAWYNLIDTSRVKIVGLSIDDKKDQWIKYIQKENFPWDTYLLKSDWNNPLIKFLNIHAVPSNVLLDSTGTVMLQEINIRKILSKLSEIHD